MYIKLLCQTVSMQIEALISCCVLADISALVCKDSLVRISLCITACVLVVFFAQSLHSVVESCWSPAGFSACLVFCAYSHAGRLSRLVFGVGEGSVLPPLLQTQPHTTPCTPQATAVSASSLVSTAHSLSLLLSLSASIATRLLHMSPKHAGRINGPSGQCWRVFGGREEKNLFRLGKLNTSFVFLGLCCVLSFLAV